MQARFGKDWLVLLCLEKLAYFWVEPLQSQYQVTDADFATLNNLKENVTIKQIFGFYWFVTPAVIGGGRGGGDNCCMSVGVFFANAKFKCQSTTNHQHTTNKTSQQTDDQQSTTNLARFVRDQPCSARFEETPHFISCFC